MIAYLRAFFRVIALLLITLIIGGLQTLLMWLPRPYFYYLPNLWGRLAVWAFGIKMIYRGKPYMDRPTIFIANHSSYLDIITLSAALKACFISKASVEHWPIAGWLAQIQGTVFINRRREEAKKQADILADRVQSGDNLILFAEGTTSDGNRLLPLKSSLLGVAQYAKAVQPVTLAFTALDGIPVGRSFRYLYAWIGDESMPPHFIRLLLQGEMEVTVTFHEPIRADLDNRKALANQLETTMREGLNQALNHQAC
jgi:1-acyl-sn-glycerol-3-phosphate acyltransferase